MEEQILQLKPQPGVAAPEAETEPPAADVSPDERARLHYIDVIKGLLEEALTTRTLRVLSDAMTLYLGWVVVEYGPPAAGHVLERLGAHITYFTERNRAAGEAEEAREEGKLAH